jgi:hypothetical protein
MRNPFQLGQIVATPSALAAFEESGEQPGDFLRRHASGDWGDHLPRWMGKHRFAVESNPGELSFLLGVPVRVRRPLAASEALGFRPLVEARWAHPARVERVPLMPAVTRPHVILAGRPAAQWAADARAEVVEAFS